MKRTLLCLLAVAFIGLLPAGAKRNPDVAPYGTYAEGLIGSIHAQGWLKECLDRQLSGMTGHPEALAYPFNTPMWTGEMARNGKYGKDWWRYEQTAYFTDGAVRLGILTGDKTLMDFGRRSIDHTLSRAEADPYGELGVNAEHYLWPFCVFFRAMQAQWEATGDPRIVKALEKSYLSLPGRVEYNKGKASTARNIMILEGLLWTYARTGNRALLDYAVKIYDGGHFPMDFEYCLKHGRIDEHGVTYSEHLKLPILMYAYTGQKKYLYAAMMAQHNLEVFHMLPDGVPSSGEYVQGNGSLAVHETCVVTDYTWTLGHFLTTTGQARWADDIERAMFNAAPGCVTKDFTALQYFSGPNQVIATGNSNHCHHKRGRTWMAFRPTHETECCAGNIQRAMPDYVSRMFLKGTAVDEVVAALYGPARLDWKLSGGTAVSITEKTEYPFGEYMDFVFEPAKAASFAFTFRIPQWCNGGVKVTLNGAAVKYRENGKGFATVKRKWKKGDVLRVAFEMPLEVVDFASTDRYGRVKKGNKGNDPLTPENGRDRYTYIQRGPLLYSYSIPATWTEDTAVYTYMNGKVPGNPGFKCWNITPAAPWNYAIAGKPEYMYKGLEGFPFDEGKAPCVVTVPVRKVKDWTLDQDRYTPRVPKEYQMEGEVVNLELVPYGATILRLTLFPPVKK